MADASFAERAFSAMGTNVHLLVDGPPSLLDLGQSIIERAERRWSRFLPDSELSQLNRNAGRPVVVSKETCALVASAVAAWESTGGLFDPTVHDALCTLGYDQSLQDLPSIRPPVAASDLHPAPGPAGIQIHRTASMIELPPGVSLDLGGIAKGATADLVTEALVSGGAAGSCVNIGGDLRVAGPGPDAGFWNIGFSDQLTGPPMQLADGAVCTSSTQDRAWLRGTGVEHHLVDPNTGRSYRSDVVAGTVLAKTALAAEILAKMPLALGRVDGAAFLRGHGATGLLFGSEGTVHEVSGIQPFLHRDTAARADGSTTSEDRAA